MEFGIFDFVERSSDLLPAREYAKDGYAVLSNGKRNGGAAAKSYDAQVWPDIIAAGAAVIQPAESCAFRELSVSKSLWADAQKVMGLWPAALAVMVVSATPPATSGSSTRDRSKVAHRAVVRLKVGPNARQIDEAVNRPQHVISC